MSMRELADVVEFLAGVLQAALGRRHTSRNFVAGIKDASPSLRKEILPLNLFRVATLWPKTPMTSWRSSSCPQRTHHTAGNSASLYSLKYGFAGILDHGFLEAACCAGETNPRFELPNAQNWWWQISTKRRLTGCMPQRRTRSACFRVSRPRIIILTLLLSGLLESVISFHVHVHS